MKKSFAVLGLGALGRYLVRALYEAGADVLVADSDGDTVNQFADKCTYAVTADLSDPEAIKALGLDNVDVAIICMGQAIGPSVMCTMVAKELGVPWVIAKATTRQMETLLFKVGADEVINVEYEMSERIARRLISDSFLEYFDLGSDLAAVELYPKPAWVGKSLRELNLRQQYGINVIAVKRQGASVQAEPDVPLSKDSRLVIVSGKSDLEKLL